MTHTTTVKWGLLKEDGAMLTDRDGQPRIFHVRDDARVEKVWRARMRMDTNLRVVKIRVESTYTVIE